MEAGPSYYRPPHRRLCAAETKKSKPESPSPHSNAGATSDVMKTARPNYFIAVQVNDLEIKDVAMRIQAGIREASGQDLSQFAVAPETFHITLMVTFLANEEQLARASVCLERCVPAIKAKLKEQQLKLDFEKLSVFGGGRVVFGCVKDPGQKLLQLMADEVKTQMKECNVENTDPENKPFNPHLTLMKYRWKSEKRSQNSKSKSPKKIESLWYEAFAEEYLGSQTIRSLQLCRMENKREDGYYFVNHEVPF